MATPSGATDTRRILRATDARCILRATDTRCILRATAPSRLLRHRGAALKDREPSLTARNAPLRERFVTSAKVMVVSPLALTC